MTVTVALDAMGGDHGPSVVVPAALSVLASRDIELILVGDEQDIARELKARGAAGGARLRIEHAPERVEMNELPSQALRNKRNSSMRLAVNLVKEQQAAACVSAGNTGALMATARFVLKTLPGIDRPAIISALPSFTGHTHVLDLGANVESTPEQLFQFAVMGAVLVSAVDNIPRPSVGLLNIGQEEIKGNERVKEAGRLLARSELNYIGFVEGDDIFKGGVNVVVCDGFVGNVALKTGEGVAQFISRIAREEFKRNALTKIIALAALPITKRFQQRIDPRRYNGASFVGLRGIVIKSHGSADVVAFARAIGEAVAEVKKNVPERISHQLESMLTLTEREAV